MQKLKERWRLVENKNAKKNDVHHLYQNHGLDWWINFTLHDLSTYKSKRFRFSLKTKDVEKAKKRRDKILKEIKIKYGATY